MAEGVVKRFGARALVGFSFVSALITVVLGAREILDLRGPGWSVVFALFACFVAAGAIIAVVVLQWWHHVDEDEAWKKYNAEHQKLIDAHQAEISVVARAARYDAALPHIHNAFHVLRDADAIIREAVPGNSSQPIYHPLLVNSLAHFASAWNAVTGVACRVAVKELVSNVDQSNTVIDLSTDARHFDVRHWIRSAPAPRASADAPTPLSENSDFKIVMDQGDDRRFFFSNDLDRTPGYINPHRRPDGQAHEYNAAMVWPVQRRLDDHKVRLLGFLCVDSIDREVFREASDFHLGAAFADTLYSLLSAEQALRSPQPVPTQTH